MEIFPSHMLSSIIINTRWKYHDSSGLILKQESLRSELSDKLDILWIRYNVRLKMKAGQWRTS